jgi:chromosome segregation ATPase
LEKRVKALRASEKALQNEVDKLRQKLAEAEGERTRGKAGLAREERRRQNLRGRLDGLIGRLSELPALREPS